MIIKSNIEAMQTYQNLTRVDSAFNKSLAKISSGLALPKPEFGGGFFAVANDMEAIYKEYTIAANNVQDAQGWLEVAQTAIMEANEMILQMDEMAHRAATETINTDQRAEMDMAFQQIMSNIDLMYSEARFNEVSVFGAAGAAREISIVFGENRVFNVSVYDMTAATIGYVALELSQATLASAAMNGMQTVVNRYSQRLAQIGGQIAEIEGKVNIINEQAVQQKAMEARINELDFAKEMKNFTSLQVVLQASNSMTAQANMKAQMVLQLFGGQ
jgi:flagellin